MEYIIEDPEEFVEQWLAFSLTNLGGKEPSIEYMNDFERKEFLNKAPKQSSKYSPEKKFEDSNNDDLAFRNDIMDTYNTFDSPKVVFNLLKKYYFAEGLVHI